MKKHIWFSLVCTMFFALSAPAVNAGTVFFDDMESGEGEWTATGLWHLQSNPDDIAISSDINPGLVSLPDYGYLPSAYLGDSVWWYGSAEDGTFMGDWTLASQSAKNGGRSDTANEGELISGDIDLTTSDDATLKFWSWWEIEGVDVDRYDLMNVYVSTDNGATWTDVVRMNPINDVDGESFKPYSSGGLGEVGQWIHVQADLSAYVGNVIKLKFYFDTVDEKYNGFRGWLIDDVQITNDVTVKPSFNSQTAQASEQCVSINFATTPARFYLYRSQQVRVDSPNSRWFITPFGSDDYVAFGETTSQVFLNAGYYVLWVKFLEGETCPDAVMVSGTISFDGGPGQAIAQPGGVVWLNGDNFMANSTVSFIPGPGPTSVQAITDATEVVVVSTTEIQVTVPYTLANGTYGIRVTSPSGKKATIANALTVTTDTAPSITVVSPEEVDDSVDTVMTITGTGFVDGAVAAIGGVPLTGLTVTDTEMTGILPSGAVGGFQNVDVINPDGQETELIGAVYIADNSTTSYTPSGDATVKPGKVKGVRVTKSTTQTAKIRWKAASGEVDHYIVQVKKGKKLKKQVTTTKRKVKVTGLKSATIYNVQVRAVGAYLGGKYSKKVQFGTLN